jgi:hypothetical protein
MTTETKIATRNNLYPRLNAAGVDWFWYTEAENMDSEEQNLQGIVGPTFLLLLELTGCGIIIAIHDLHFFW